MALEIRGEPIVAQGELIRLMRALDPRGRGSGILPAFFAGEEVQPHDLAAALDVEARLSVRTDDRAAHGLIDTMLARLRRAFPDEVTG